MSFPTREVHPQQLRRGDAKVDEWGNVVARALKVKKNAHGPDQTDVLWEGYALPHTYADHRVITIAAGVVCGNCSTSGPKGLPVQHPTAEDVRACFALRYDVEDEPETCHHNMNAIHCLDPFGPHHFGTREWEIAMGF
jgi:hypothetical protein